MNASSLPEFTFSKPGAAALVTSGEPMFVEAQPATSNSPAPYYVRLQLLDRPGALAKVASALGDAGVSIDRMRQGHHDGTEAPVLIVTHKTQRSALLEALAEIKGTGVLSGDPVALRIETV